MVVPIGAAAYASGSHVWNGISGTFTANPRKTPPKMSVASAWVESPYHPSFTEKSETSSPVRAFSDSTMKSSVPLARKIARNESSIVTLPASV